MARSESWEAAPAGHVLLIFVVFPAHVEILSPAGERNQ